MKGIIRVILFTALICSCSDLKYFRHDTEVIAVFGPDGVGDQSSTGLMYKGMVSATESLGISFRPIFPLTYEEGAETVAKLASRNEKGRKRLIISADPWYSEHLRNIATEGKIVDSDSTKLLVIDGDFTHSDVYTAYVPFYGMMYKAGYVASRMSDVENVRIYIANDRYRYIREGKDGFIAGFTQNKECNFEVVDFSIDNEDITEGFFLSSNVYLFDGPECSELYDMILPLCGDTIMGFLRYNREFPGSFYTVGMETDMSAYSSDVPFSCVEHLDKILISCITDWSENRLSRHRTFGMDEGWVELVISEDYMSLLGPAAAEIHAKAIEKEDGYEG